MNDKNGNAITSDTGSVDWREIQQKFQADTATQPASSCPHCGYCPHCGRGGYVDPSWWYQPYTTPHQPSTIWCNTSYSNTNAPGMVAV